MSVNRSGFVLITECLRCCVDCIGTGNCWCAGIIVYDFYLTNTNAEILHHNSPIASRANDAIILFLSAVLFNGVGIGTLWVLVLWY